MSQLPSPSPDLPPHHQVTVVDLLWSRVLEFTYLFRGFRLAINPSKIIIALMAIVLIYCAGRTFDLAWGPKVFDGEIDLYQTSKTELFRNYRDQKIQSQQQRIRSMLSEMSFTLPNSTFSKDDLDYYINHPRAAGSKLESLYQEVFQRAIKEAAESRKETENGDLVLGDAIKPMRPAGYRTPAEVEIRNRQDAAETLLRSVTSMRKDIGSGIFDAFMTYELKQADGLVSNTLSFVRVSPVRHEFDLNSAPPSEENAVTGGLISTEPERLWKSDTVVGCVANMTITGPSWLFTSTAPMQYRSSDTGWWGTIKTYGYRGLFLASLLVFAVFCLAVVAVSGGMICRLSALEFSGQDKPNVPKAFRFVMRRFWDLVRAPLMPFAILLFIGLVITLVGFIGAIPWLGEMFVGVFFILFLIAGFVAMLVLLGILGGFNLLYPTIAVEGSDSFDAMSRGFAYVYARPWRVLFYSIVSLVYGVVTFLFVAFAVYLILAITHVFLGWGMSLFGNQNGFYSGLPKLETLWPSPHVQRLSSPTNWWAMNWSEWTGAMALHFWLYLLISCVGAYVISYYHSTNTIIYFLLRRSVDGQSLTDVYDSDPEPTKPEPAPTPATEVAPVTPAPAQPT